MRRTPKQLDREPTVFEAIGAPGGFALRARGGRRPVDPGRIRPGSPLDTSGDDEAHLTEVSEDGPDIGGAVLARARQIATRLAVPRPRRDPTAARGAGTPASLPYRGGSDEIDLDRTLEVLAERPVIDDADIVVRERVRARRSVMLAVDVSGSMKGERIITAAATVGALAARLRREALGVVAFWSDAAVLLEVGDVVRPSVLVELLAHLPARGLTNVAFPLQLAATGLSHVPARDARVILLSDCVHNAGPDPRPIAARLPRLDVLLDATGEKDVDLGRELAREGHGTLHLVRRYQDVAPAIVDIFRN